MKKIGFKTQKKKQININQVLVVQPPRRVPVDIGKWRSAMKSAERGYRSIYYDLIDDLCNDLVLSSSVNKRIMAITNSEILFQKNKKPVDAMIEFIDTPEFEFLITEFMLTKFYGKTVVELFWEKEQFKPFSIPRKHLHTGLKKILKNTHDSDGISYENDDWLINLGSDTDLGLFNKTAVFAIFKRNGGSDYAQFCELFGIPQMVGLYDPDDESGREEMEVAFKNRGSGGSMTMSKNSDVKTIGDTISGNVNIHDRFLSWCDEQMLIGINGQTMTTKDGSSYSQANVHQDTENDINKADRRYIQRILNTELLPRLEKRGYPVSGGKFEFAEKGETLSKEQQLAIAQAIDDRTDAGVDEDYWFETFNLPKGKREEKKSSVGSGQLAEPATDNRKLNTENLKSGQLPVSTEHRKLKTENLKSGQLAEPATDNRQSTTKKLSFLNSFLDFFYNAPR